MIDRFTKVNKKIHNFLYDPVIRFNYLTRIGFFNHISDEEYLSKAFKVHFNYYMDFNQPKTFNEKLQWLKLHDRNPLYTKLADKYEVRDYIAEKIGNEYLIPLIGVWDNPNEIDFEELPEKFVLKCNHNSGTGLCISGDKSKLDYEQIRKDLRIALKEDYYLLGREWPYKNIKRKIICEEKIGNDNPEGLIDYKFMCFNGKVEYVFTCTERFSDQGLKVTFFDRNWNKLPIQRHYPLSEREIPKPSSLNLMIDLAEKLSEDMPFVRIDFYEVDQKPLFGEITFYPGSGFEEFTPAAWDYAFGSLITII